jgi:hypothetical protein
MARGFCVPDRFPGKQMRILRVMVLLAAAVSFASCKKGTGGYLKTAPTPELSR